MPADGMRGVEAARATARADHTRMRVGIPPKRAAGGVVGRPRGRCPTVLHNQHPEWRAAAGVFVKLPIAGMSTASFRL